ncbi:MAG: helix-turn-helix transcriptional regulator, partial [Bacteroidia bacterium]|nr:helix-turn-helix transcriptional regulator [Bacteroidia bacterium]
RLMVEQTGQRVRKYREMKNFTQEYMAEQLGMSQQNYSKLESGNVAITVNQLEKISEVLGANIGELLGSTPMNFTNFHNQVTGENAKDQKISMFTFDYSSNASIQEFLKEECEFLRKRIISLEEDVKFYRTLVTDLKRDLKAQQYKIEELELEAETAYKQLDSLQKKLEGLDLPELANLLKCEPPKRISSSKNDLKEDS